MQITGNGFLIRSLGEEDAGAIFDVYRMCEDFLALGPEPHASMRMVLDDLGHSREEGGIFCGIEVSGELVGVVDFVPDNFGGRPGTAFLSLLMIAREHRVKGLGRKVVEALEEEILKNASISEIRSGTQVNNPGGIAFWKRMGYQIVGGPELMPDTTTVYHLLKETK